MKKIVDWVISFIIAVCTIGIGWLFIRIPWIFGLTLGLILVGFLVWFIAKPNEYLFDCGDKVKIFFVRTLNPFRRPFNKLPIWIVPCFHSAVLSEYCNVSIDIAIRSWENIKNILMKIDLSYRQTKRALHHVYTICGNIVAALWKLWSLEQMELAVSAKFDEDDRSLQEIKEIKHLVTNEIDRALEILTIFFVRLTKLSNKAPMSEEINRALEEIESVNQELVETAGSNNQYYIESTPYSLWTYTAVFVIVVVTFAVSSRYVPEHAVAITISGSLVAFLVIGILRLRDVGKISENSFVRIVVELLRGFLSPRSKNG